MKRWLSLLTALILLFSLSGCLKQEQNSCTFYYLRTPDTIAYGREDSLIAPLSRELSGSDAELTYLLQLYLDGPQEEEFRTPIPKGTYLLSYLWQDETLVLVLSREFSNLDNMELTLAGACLTATCHGLAGAEAIQVRSGEAVYEFRLENYTFLDGSTGQ